MKKIVMLALVIAVIVMACMPKDLQAKGGFSSSSSRSSFSSSSSRSSSFGSSSSRSSSSSIFGSSSKSSSTKSPAQTSKSYSTPSKSAPKLKSNTSYSKSSSNHYTTTVRKSPSGINYNYNKGYRNGRRSVPIMVNNHYYEADYRNVGYYYGPDNTLLYYLLLTNGQRQPINQVQYNEAKQSGWETPKPQKSTGHKVMIFLLWVAAIGLLGWGVWWVIKNNPQ